MEKRSPGLNKLERKVRWRNAVLATLIVIKVSAVIFGYNYHKESNNKAKQEAYQDVVNYLDNIYGDISPADSASIRGTVDHIRKDIGRYFDVDSIPGVNQNTYNFK